MFCISCGNKITSKEEFCTKCGQSINVNKQNETAGSESKDSFRANIVKSSGGIKKLIKFFLWLGLIIFGIWLIIALGPLWIIAIILGLILFVLANR